MDWSIALYIVGGLVALYVVAVIVQFAVLLVFQKKYLNNLKRFMEDD